MDIRIAVPFIASRLYTTKVAEENFVIALRKDWYIALRFGLMVPQGWRLDLLGITDPIEAYETMTRVAQVAEARVRI